MNLSQVSILIVDDVAAMRMQISQLLKMLGFKKIRSVPNAERATLALISEPSHLILADWYMEGASGMDLLRFVRSSPDCAHAAFIMLTAENTKNLVFEAIKSGVDDYLVKPLTPEKIQQRVIGVLLKKKVLA